MRTKKENLNSRLGQIKRDDGFLQHLFLRALQDGLEPEYMKPTEIIRNYKKLNINKLHKRIER